MFNLGVGELAVIFIVLIIAVGPDRMPTLMKNVGKGIRAMRQASRDIRSTVGIDELMREDVLREPVPKRRPPQGAVAANRTPAAPPSSAEATPTAEGAPPPSAPTQAAVPSAEPKAAPASPSPGAPGAEPSPEASGER